MFSGLSIPESIQESLVFESLRVKHRSWLRFSPCMVVPPMALDQTERSHSGRTERSHSGRTERSHLCCQNEVTFVVRTKPPLLSERSQSSGQDSLGLVKPPGRRGFVGDVEPGRSRKGGDGYLFFPERLTGLFGLAFVSPQSPGINLTP